MVSPAFRRATRARETAEVLFELVTLSHDDFSAPIRRVDNTDDVRSRGHTWLARPTVLNLPRDEDRGTVTGRIVLDDTDLGVSSELRRSSAPPSVLVEIVRADDPDTVEIDYRHLEVTAMVLAGTEVEISIGIADYRTEVFPEHSFGPSYFPELN